MRVAIIGAPIDFGASRRGVDMGCSAIRSLLSSVANPCSCANRTTGPEKVWSTPLNITRCTT